MYSISTDNPETARALIAVQCVLNHSLEAGKWPAWLLGVLPGLIDCLQTVVREDARNDDDIADLYGVSESPCNEAAPWRPGGQQAS